MTTPAAPSSLPVSGSAAPTTTVAPTTTAAPIKLAADTAKALQAALTAEQVAVWAYDIVVAYDAADAAVIATIRAGHVARRDATANLLVSGGSTAPNPAPAYTTPKPVTDQPSARTLAFAVETDCASAWRGVIGATDNVTVRGSALAALTAAAVWLTQLKVAARTSPSTVPFPGQ